MVTAPRVTLFNGQRAYVLVGDAAGVRQRPRRRSSAPTRSRSTRKSTSSSPACCSTCRRRCQPTASTSRSRSGRSSRTLAAARHVHVPDAGLGGDERRYRRSAATVVVVDGTSVPGSGIVQQPELQITEVRTTVSVPDGGTLLLGGQTLAGEIEREAGVPILSKIPFLKRLFTNRSMAKDEQVLLILVKPTIIIQREQRAEAVPAAVEQGGGAVAHLFELPILDTPGAKIPECSVLAGSSWARERLHSRMRPLATECRSHLHSAAHFRTKQGFCTCHAFVISPGRRPRFGRKKTTPRQGQVPGRRRDQDHRDHVPQVQAEFPEGAGGGGRRGQADPGEHQGDPHGAGDETSEEAV